MRQLAKVLYDRILFNLSGGGGGDGGGFKKSRAFVLICMPKSTILE